ncbi:MAG: hypothetical protein KBC06_02515 [Candidatus Pacebacteria bacterium]|nr:hypothetical protein [Candidatus Paceibacterota bacterium]
MKERFYPEEITKDPIAPKVEHFHPVKDGRDRFGNRIFYSPELAYDDRDGQRTKAALLVSKEGEEFIKTNKGILKDIAQGLATIETSGKVQPERRADLSQGRTLDFITQGGQSRFYMLKVDGKKYAIKTHHTPRVELLDQPYINEMLQTQSMAVDLKEKLAALKVRFSTFLFASGQVSCTLYEEGHRPDENASATLAALVDIAEEYTFERSEDPLWHNINIDGLDLSFSTDTDGRNFKQKPDGSLVWVDPFFV